MNIFFKIKHYLLLYFKTARTYRFNTEVFNDIKNNYWVSGYKHNIESNKWEIENGIPLGLYNGKMKAPLPRRVHISGLCEYCFALNELNQKEGQEKVVKFLVDNLAIDSISLEDEVSFSFWKTYFSNESEEYYVHGMGQGQTLSLLTRYSLGNSSLQLETKILEVSNSYLVPFSHPHGFVNVHKDTATFFEEYPKSQDDRKHVLNGWIYSIIGLNDYLNYIDRNKLFDKNYNDKKALYSNSIKTLSKHINNYNAGFWSLYNQPKGLKHITSIHYQEQHIVLLEALAHITSDKLYLKYSRLFKKQYNNIFYRIFALFVKVFLSNLIKHGWIYKRN